MKISEKEFFDFVQERQNIYIRKEILKLDPPYTEDEVLRKYHFCNVFREQDAGTKVVMGLESDNDLELLTNIVCYRIFNRRNHFDRIGWINIDEYDRQTFREKLVSTKETGPIFNTAYLTTWSFSYILDGLEYIINNNFNLKDCESPEEVYKKLQKIKCVGPFLAYQLFLDLSYFGKRFHKWDGNSLVVAGPGSKPQIAYMLGIDIKDISDQQCIDYMVYLRDIQDRYLNLEKKLDLAAVEHGICEARKYFNFKNNTGKKRLFKKI
jgi:hypothetical protein